MARRDFGDAFRPKAPLFGGLFSETFPGGEERNPSPSRLSISAISPGLPAGQLCITAVPGVKSIKCATNSPEKGRALLHLPGAKSAQTTFSTWVNICVDFQFLQNRPSPPDSLSEFFLGGKSRGQILDLQWRYPLYRPPRGP